jgi:hypothetical protein
VCRVQASVDGASNASASASHNRGSSNNNSASLAVGGAGVFGSGLNVAAANGVDQSGAQLEKTRLNCPG